VLVKVRYLAEGAVFRVFGKPPPGAPPSVGMSRAVISGGEDHQLAADLQPFAVEEPAELLRRIPRGLAAQGIEEASGGNGSRDGGLEQDLEDNQAA
jgi:hypothetical protein